VTRILIVDDHSVVRKGLRQILSETAGMIVGGEAATGQQALEMAARERSNDFLVGRKYEDDQTTFLTR
jgi:DNA-binding NarL/FixJ family response regulator